MANGSQQKFSKKMQNYKQIVAQVRFRRIKKGEDRPAQTPYVIEVIW